jgi:hypothetical protein
MIKTKKTITTFESTDGALKAEVVQKEDGNWSVFFYRFNELVQVESYGEHSEIYHEDAAENYVLGIKKI